MVKSYGTQKLIRCYHLTLHWCVTSIHLQRTNKKNVRLRVHLDSPTSSSNYQHIANHAKNITKTTLGIAWQHIRRDSTSSHDKASTRKGVGEHIPFKLVFVQVFALVLRSKALRSTRHVIYVLATSLLFSRKVYIAKTKAKALAS